MASKLDFRPLLELMGLMIAGMFLSALLNQLLFSPVTASSPANTPLEFLGAVTISLVCSFGLPSFLWLKYRGTLVADVKTHGSPVSAYAIAFVLFVALVFVGEYFSNWAYRFLELRGWSNLIQEPFSLTSVRDVLVHEELLPLVLLVVALVPALVEEFFFRRIIFSYLLQASRNFWSPAILSALFFAGMHNHLLSFFPIFLLGLALAFAYYTTRNIGVPILLHAANNGVSIVLIKYDLADALTTHWLVALFAALLSGYIFMNQLPAKSDMQRDDA